MTTTNNIKHIVLDFDGVIRDPFTNKPMEGAQRGILKLAGNKITIVTANNVPFVQTWIIKNLKKVIGRGLIYEVTNVKPSADIYVDDKGYRFTNWKDLLDYFRSDK